MSQSSNFLVLRAAPSAYIVFGGMFAPLLLLSLYIFLKKGRDLWVVAMVGVILLFCWLWLATFQLSVNKEAVSYRTLFGGTSHLSVSEIESARTEIDFGKFGPPFRLIIRPKAGARRKPLIVNMKVFRLNELREFIRTLETMTQSEIPLHHSLFRKPIRNS